MNPTVRRGLLVESTGDEVVAVDEDTHEVFALDAVAACVFAHADGTRDVAGLVEVLRSSVDPSADAERVWATLDRLADAGLLLERTTPPVGVTSLDRRSLLRKGAAGTAALGAGVVVAGLIPTAAAATSAPVSQEEIDKLQEQGTKQGEEAAKLANEQGEKQGEQTGKEVGAKAGEMSEKQAELTKEKLGKNPPN